MTFFYPPSVRCSTDKRGMTKMEVAKIKVKSGEVFYSADHGLNLMREIMKRCRWSSIELIEMMEDEYYSIPATKQASDLFTISPKK